MARYDMTKNESGARRAPPLAVALRHVAYEDLGLLEPWLVWRGWRVRYIDLGLDELCGWDALAPDLLVVLGGPLGAEDDDDFPFLAEEVRCIRARLDAQRPTLGICLGAQLMARALGARVRPMGTKELGYFSLELTPAAVGTPIARIGAQPVLQWHGDVFDLPDGVQSLARTPLCPNQAFMVEDHAMAWQFHLEVAPSRLERWLISNIDEIRACGLRPDELRRQARAQEAGLQQAAAAVMQAWFERLDL